MKNKYFIFKKSIEVLLGFCRPVNFSLMDFLNSIKTLQKFISKFISDSLDNANKIRFEPLHPQNEKAQIFSNLSFSREDEWDRTIDPLLKRQMLYP